MIGDLASFTVTAGDDPAQMLADLAVIDLLRLLQDQAEAAGLRMAALLIATAAQAALDEGVRLEHALPN